MLRLMPHLDEWSVEELVNFIVRGYPEKDKNNLREGFQRAKDGDFQYLLRV